MKKKKNIKKIKELTDSQLFEIIYENNDEVGELITYEEREALPHSPKENAAKDISYCNCVFCRRWTEPCKQDCRMCDIKFNEIRNSIYADDEVKIK